jgi:hypothetical protein
MATSWLDLIREQVLGAGSVFLAQVREHGVMPLLQPVAPWDRPSFMAPAVALGGLLGILLLSGLAVTALGSLTLALLGLYLLLVEVFGMRIELHPFGR